MNTLFVQKIHRALTAGLTDVQVLSLSMINDRNPNQSRENYACNAVNSIVANEYSIFLVEGKIVNVNIHIQRRN